MPDFTLEGVCWSALRPGVLTPGKRPGARYSIGYVVCYVAQNGATLWGKELAVCIKHEKFLIS